MQKLEQWADEAREYFGNDAIGRLQAMVDMTWPQLMPLLARGTDAFYHTNFKFKPDLTVRKINSPWGPLRLLLKRMLEYFYHIHGMPDGERVSCSFPLLSSAISHSQPGRSCLTNVETHRNSCFEWQADLLNAFGQVNACQVEAIVQEYMAGNDRLVQLLAYLLTIWDQKPTRYYRRPRLEKFIPAYFTSRSLAQGAHTSPFLLEKACQGLDHRLIELTAATDIIVTRYVDDISVTSGRPITGQEISAFREAIRASGFAVNPKKEHYLVQKAGQPLEVNQLFIHPGGRITMGQALQRQCRTVIRAAWRLVDAGDSLAKEQRALINKAKGLIAMARGVYGPNFPPQIRGEAEVFEAVMKSK